MVKEEPQAAVNGNQAAVNGYQSAVNDSQSAVNDSQSAVNGYKSAVKRDSKETRKKNILNILSNRNLSSDEISQDLGIKISTTRLYLSELVTEGKIGFTGTYRNRTYHIIKK